MYAGEQSREPHDLVLDYLRRHRPSWPSVESEAGLAEHKGRLRGLFASVLDLPDESPHPEVTTRAAKRSGDLRLTPVVMRSEEGIVLPGHLKRLVIADGFRVLAMDLRGQGETAPGLEGKFWDFLAGRPIFAQRVADGALHPSLGNRIGSPSRQHSRLGAGSHFSVRRHRGDNG